MFMNESFVLQIQYETTGIATGGKLYIKAIDYKVDDRARVNWERTRETIVPFSTIESSP